MGNCQAIDAAALVIQHPDGRLERLYWPVTASEVMKMNPGHYVSLIIPLPLNQEENHQEKKVRFTRVKLLRSTDTLVLGRAYRLITTQEVMKVLRAKKNGKMRKNQLESTETEAKQSSVRETEEKTSDSEKSNEGGKTERNRQSMTPMNSASARLKSWRPSLQSISESAS